MRANKGRVLLHGDTDVIKEFVFETSFLPQIRGGSSLLLECEKKATEKVKELGGNTIYCSGGSFLFEIPASKAEAAKDAIEEIYLERTLAATVTVVYEEDSLPPALANPPQDGWAGRLWVAHQEAQQGGEFARRVAFLGAQVRQAKVQKRSAPFCAAFPFGRRCQACGKRVAQEEVLRYEPEEQERVERIALCSVCLQRHRTGVKGRGRKVRGRFNQDFSQEYRTDAQQPPDLDHLIKSARRGYVAFLYADGNDIGKLLQQVHSEKEFKTLSDALTEGTRRALFEALWEACRPALQESGYWPFEIVNIGGDDVTLLIQAGYAWEVAVKFLEKFEAHVPRLVLEALGTWPSGWPKKITASCGIAIADVKYPVRYLEYLASDLLKMAKREDKADKQNPQSAVTYLWLPNPVAAEKAEPLMSYYQRGDNRLTARPYTLERAKKLADLVGQASQWPRSLRHRWGEALDNGLWVSLNTVYYDIARRREEDRVLLNRFLSEVSELAIQQAHQTIPPGPLWQPYQAGKKSGWRTALLDVLELAELRAMRSDVREEEER